MKSAFAFLATAATHDTRTGLASVIEIGHDVVTSSQFPAGKYSLSLVFKLIAEKNEVGIEHTVSVKIFGPNGEVPCDIGQIKITPNGSPHLPSGMGHVTGHIAFQRLMFPCHGEYYFKVYVDGVQAVEVPLYLALVPNPKEA